MTERAAGYAVARDRFDGDDVLRVKERIGEAVARARKDKTPTLVEVVTYRFRGHSMSDPGNYRTKDEIEEWKKRDAVPLARERLLKEYRRQRGRDRFSGSVDQSRGAGSGALRRAVSPTADPNTVWDFVYADSNIDPRKM